MKPAVIHLTESDLKRATLSVLDDAGTVFFWQGRVLRGVRAEAADRIRSLLDGGLLVALMARRWIPRCWKADVAIEGFALVIEQEQLPVVSYPFEWSYGMLRDAAARVLEINSLARLHGWELKDCHGFNVVFDGPQPLWVDLGSFVTCDAGARGWPAYEEFLRSYDYPLRIWSDGGGFTALRLSAASEPMSHADYGLYRWPWLRWGGAGVYQRSLLRWHRQYRVLSRMADEKIRRRLPSPLGYFVCLLKAWGWLPGQNLSMERLRRRTVQRRRRGPGGVWSDYQAQGLSFVSTPRFNRIAALVRELKVDAVIELGGNQGWLAEQLLRDGAVKLAICTDADELAVDRAYERTKQAGGCMHTAVLDFVFPLATPFGEPPARRLQADLVLALAVTHHLLLSQKIPVERVLHAIAAYARCHVMVEFMPLGLWDGKQAPPVPAWYNRDWFRTAFMREFELTHEEQLEENRVLFCGTLRRTPAVT